MKTGSAAAIFIAAALLLQGCLYTSHHFNTGRILAPGNTAVTLGYGHANSLEHTCDYNNGFYEEEDSLGTVRCINNRWFGGDSVVRDTMAPGLSEVSLPRFSLGYRLGVRGPWGPFTGLELGWHLEAPTNPGSAEFDLKFGLPTGGSERFFHSASGGWIIGMWSDNSFFGEYAASRSFGSGGADAHALYGSLRITRLATQPDDAFPTDASKMAFGHKTRWAQQASLGYHFRMPDWPVLPDYLSPQATVSMPYVAVLGGVKPEEDYILNFNLGFGWRF